jgi:hypothetical protein
MNYLKMQKLGKEMNKLENKRLAVRDELSLVTLKAKDLHAFICDRLTYKQYMRWTTYPSTERFQQLHRVTRNKQILTAAREYLTVCQQIAELRGEHEVVLRQLDARPQLNLAVSNPYDWYDLTVLKLSRVLPRRNDRKNQAHLTLVR